MTSERVQRRIDALLDEAMVAIREKGWRTSANVLDLMNQLTSRQNRT